ncbi:uncharacterized protein FFE2_16051 [Fusarium fujikuroi]|nr:uncharacterized protein FFE2_16051 [Fusarium fujikuroi]
MVKALIIDGNAL